MPESDATIAIDGPGAVGKTTVGRILARRLGWLFVDTGLMYRALTATVAARRLDPNGEAAVAQLARTVRIRIAPGTTPDSQRVTVDGEDVTSALRTREVDAQVSTVSSYAGVREAMVSQQRALASEESVVMVGRDIGTAVLPDARLKVYLTASAEVRARRRHAETQDAGRDASFETVLAELKRRDATDSQRVHSPLKPALDAIIVDTSHLSAVEVVERILELWRSVG